MAALDHQWLLLRAIEAALGTISIRGGWHIARLEQPRWPVGYFEITRSRPVRAQDYLHQEHRGIISVYSRNEPPATPEEAFRISHEAWVELDQGVSAVDPGFQITKLNCGELTPRNLDGLTWGRSFLFSAITHEVT